MSKQLTSAEIKRKKAIQARISQTTGALGLASLGAFAAGRAGGTGKFALKAQRAVPKLRRINPATADKVALGTSTAGAGLGGLGSFNFASYTAAEGKKKPVKKNWNPVGTNYSPEAKRYKRMNRYEQGAAATSGALAGGGVATALRGVDLADQAKTAKAGKKAYKGLKTASNARFKTSGKLAALSGGAALTGVAINRRKKSGSWDSYAKRDVPPTFGSWID